MTKVVDTKDHAAFLAARKERNEMISMHFRGN